MSKKELHKNQANKTIEMFKGLISLILPEQLTFEEQIKSLEKQRLKIQGILKKSKK